MAHPKLLETDENANGEIIFFTTTGEQYANKSDILAFIEEFIQPSHVEGPGIICDPFAREETVYEDPALYYDEHTEYVDHRYFKEVILKKGV